MLLLQKKSQRWDRCRVKCHRKQ